MVIGEPTPIILYKPQISIVDEDQGKKGSLRQKIKDAFAGESNNPFAWEPKDKRRDDWYGRSEHGD
jgi:hypothetical protein